MSRPNRHGERSGACSARHTEPADREADANVRPSALRPAVALAHLKPGGSPALEGSEMPGGRKAESGCRSVMNRHRGRSPGRRANAIAQSRRGGRSAERPISDYPAGVLSSARHPLLRQGKRTEGQQEARSAARRDRERKWSITRSEPLAGTTTYARHPTANAARPEDQVRQAKCPIMPLRMKAILRWSLPPT